MIEQEFPDDLVEAPAQRSVAEEHPVPNDLTLANIDPHSQVGIYQQVQPMLQKAQEHAYESVLHDIGPDQGLVGGVNSLMTAAKNVISPPSLTDPSKIGADALSRGIVDSIRQSVPSTSQDAIDWEGIHKIVSELPPEVQGMVYKDQYIANKQYEQSRLVRQVGDEAEMMATLPFFMPQRMIMGNIVRATHPELMDRVRVDDERLDRSDIVKSLDAIGPPLYLGSDVVSPRIKSLLTNVNEPADSILNSIIAPLAGAIAGGAIDVGGDPWTWFTFGAESVENAAAKGIQMSVEGAASPAERKTLGELVKIASPNSEPLFMDASRNIYKEAPTLNKVETNALTIGRGPLKMVVKGEIVQRYVEAAKAMAANASIGWGAFEVRPGVFLQGFATNTSNDAFNMARNVARNEAGLGAMIADHDMANSFKQVLGDKPLSEGVSRYARNYSELGQEGADQLASRMKLKLTDDEKQTAVMLGESVRDWRNWASNVSEQMTGIKSPKFSQASAVEMLDAVSNDKNVAKLWDNVDPELRPYIFAKNADVGRRASGEGLKAMRQMGQGYDTIDATAKQYGLKSLADAFKERDKLSTWAADLLRSKEFNVKNFYDTNLLGTAQAQVRDIFETAANNKFAQFSVKLGKTKEEWNQAINQARALVSENGIALTHPDIYRLSKLDPAIMTPVNDSAFNSLRRSVTEAEGFVTNANLADKKNLLFEPSVAAAINTHFAPMRKVGLAAAASWFNSLLTRSGLSSLTRLVPQTYEAFTASFGRASPGDYVDAISSAMKPVGERDFAGKFFYHSGLAQNVSKMDDVGRVPVSVKMLHDDGLNAAWTNSMQQVRDMIEAKQFDKSLTDYAKQAFEKTVKGVEFVEADHPIKRTIRAAINHFEDIPKEAVFRSKYRQFGDVNKAAYETGREMMDFRFTSDGVSSALKPFMQFANYNAKALERMLLLAGKNPGLVTLFDERQGHIARAIHNLNGWSPYQVEGMRRTYNMPVEPMFMGFLPGMGAIPQDQQNAQSTLNNIINGVIGNLNAIGKDSYTQGMIQASKEGFQAMAKLPSFMSGPIDMFRKPFSDRGLGGMVTPAINVGAILMTGKDLATGETIPLSSQQDNLLRSMQERLSHINGAVARPFQDKNFWNIFDATGKIAFEIHAPRINEALDSPVLQAALGVLGKTNPKINNGMDKLKVDKDHLSRLVNTLTAGLIITRDGDLPYNMAVRNLLKQRGVYLEQFKEAAIKGDVDRVSSLKGDIRNLVDQLHQAVDFRDAYESQTYKMRQNPSLESNLIGKEIQQFEPVDDETLKPTAPTTPPDNTQDDFVPEDLSPSEKGGATQPKSDRAPAGKLEPVLTLRAGLEVRPTGEVIQVWSDGKPRINDVYTSLVKQQMSQEGRQVLDPEQRRKIWDQISNTLMTPIPQGGDPAWEKKRTRDVASVSK